MNSPNPMLETLKEAYADLAQARTEAMQLLATHLDNGDRDAYTQAHKNLRRIAEEFKAKIESSYSTLPDGRRVFTPDLAALQQFADGNLSDISRFVIDLDGDGRVEALAASGCGISRLEALAGLRNLTELWLGFNQVADLTSLSELSGLNVIYLNCNQISDITPLSQLTELTHLSLDRNRITDLTPLSRLKGLTTLSLSGNHITVLAPLAELTTLTTLRLDYKQIADKKIIKLLLEGGCDVRT